MKQILFLMILIGSFSALAEQSQWAAQSTEKQFDLSLDKTSRLQSVTGTAPSQQKTQTLSLQALSRQQVAQQQLTTAMEHHFWIYDAWVTLIDDTDHDGYYSTLAVGFDADTEFLHADVFARLYLSRGDEFFEYHTTSVFHIGGEDEEDFLEVETELLEGFPADDYEILIDLYDAETGELVATYTSDQDEDLIYLPLESQDYEFTVVETRVSISHDNGGSMGTLCWGLLLVLLIRLKQPGNAGSRF